MVRFSIFTCLFWFASVAAAASDVEISDRCYIDPRSRLQGIYQEILPQTLESQITVSIALDLGSLIKHTGPYAATIEKVGGVLGFGISWQRREGLATFVDSNVDGRIDHVALDGVRKDHRDFQAQTHACHALEMILNAGDQWQYQEDN